VFDITSQGISAQPQCKKNSAFSTNQGWY